MTLVHARTRLPTPMSASGDLELWYRYLDWSAAQVNHRILEMSPDEMWRLAQRVSPEVLPFLELVQQIAVAVAHELELPGYDAWKESYLRDPAPFDREMMGVGTPFGRT